MKYSNKIIFISLLILLILSSCAPIMQYRGRGEEPIIRILLIRNPSRLIVSSDFKIEIKTGNSSGLLDGPVRINTNPLKVRTSRGEICDVKYPIYLIPRDGSIYINERAYPGGIKITKGSDILVVNHINIEEYLKGVIPHEMGHLPEDMIEALKAQAIAARSYAMANRKPQNEYDILPTIWDQVYGGVQDVDAVINRAVESTRGIVATYGGQIINAKYSSTCGGITEDNENIWKGNRVPYLRSVRDSGWDGKHFCRFSPHYRWERSYEKNSFFDVVKEQIRELFGQTPGEVKWLRITKRTRTNRVRTIEIQTDIGKFYLDRDQIRRLFADFRGSLKSLMFWIKVKGNRINIYGRGYGHGVGMCQYGAMEMAKENYSFQQIIHHYYTGVRLVKLW